MRRTALIAAALLALTGCGLIPGGDTGNDSAGNDSAGNAAAENMATANQVGGPSDAGVTRSRSLLGLNGGGEGLGDKTPTAIQAGAQNIPAEMLLGSWSDDGNCKQAIEFLADGSFRAANGEGGRWGLEGDVLTLTGAGGRYQLRITSIDAGRVTTQNPDGTPGQSTRC